MSQKNNQIYSTHTAEVKAEGVAEGESKKSREIARNLLKNGIGISIIVAVTGLPEEEIRSLPT